MSAAWAESIFTIVVEQVSYFGKFDQHNEYVGLSDADVGSQSFSFKGYFCVTCPQLSFFFISVLQTSSLTAPKLNGFNLTMDHKKCFYLTFFFTFKYPPPLDSIPFVYSEYMSEIETSMQKIYKGSGVLFRPWRFAIPYICLVCLFGLWDLTHRLSCNNFDRNSLITRPYILSSDDISCL